VLGRNEHDDSGRSLMARQQSGLIELANLYGALEDWELRIYRQCWGRVKQFNQQMLSSEDPYEAAYQAYNREQIVAKVSPDRLAAFEAWEKAQAEAQAAAPTHTPSTAPAPPPRSLATAPGNGAAGAPHIPVGEGEAFRAAIPH